MFKVHDQGVHVNEWAGCHAAAEEEAVPKRVRGGVTEELEF